MVWVASNTVSITVNGTALMVHEVESIMARVTMISMRTVACSAAGITLVWLTVEWSGGV